MMLIDRGMVSGLVSRARELLEISSGRIPFFEEISVRVEPLVLWAEIEKAMLDSTRSRIWPNEYVTIVSDGLEPFAILKADYKFFFSRVVYHYKIIEFEKGISFQYQALQDHIFKGGARIEIREVGGGSVLQWSGEYLFDKSHSPQALMFKLYFQDRFFGRLRENLKSFEKSSRRRHH